MVEWTQNANEIIIVLHNLIPLFIVIIIIYIIAPLLVVAVVPLLPHPQAFMVEKGLIGGVDGGDGVNRRRSYLPDGADVCLSVRHVVLTCGGPNYLPLSLGSRPLSIADLRERMGTKSIDGTLLPGSRPGDDDGLCAHTSLPLCDSLTVS